MAANVLVDAGFLIALLSRRDRHHPWARARSPDLALPWTCEAALSEAFHLLGVRGRPRLAELLRRRAEVPTFDLAENLDRVMHLMQEYANVPMSLADGCLVRMSETLADPLLLTTETDFRVYRRHGRLVVPCMMPY